MFGGFNTSLTAIEMASSRTESISALEHPFVSSISISNMDSRPTIITSFGQTIGGVWSLKAERYEDSVYLDVKGGGQLYQVEVRFRFIA